MKKGQIFDELMYLFQVPKWLKLSEPESAKLTT